MNRKTFINLLIGVQILVALTAIAGWLFSIPNLYTWTGTPMAINTAFLFVINSCIVSLIINYNNGAKQY